MTANTVPKWAASSLRGRFAPQNLFRNVPRAELAAHFGTVGEPANRRIGWRCLLALCSLAFTSLAGAAERERDGKRSERKPTAPSNKTAASTAASPATPPALNSLESFQILSEKNIFNPNRIGRSRATVPEKPPRVDEISLVGTMEYYGGVVAFFDSPDAAFRKSVRAGEVVGDFTVREINADGVELTRADKPLKLRVAQQLRRAEGGDWTVITIVPPPQPSGTGGAYQTPEERRAAEAAAASAVPADASEVLRRLLKKREKQLLK